MTIVDTKIGANAESKDSRLVCKVAGDTPVDTQAAAPAASPSDALASPSVSSVPASGFAGTQAAAKRSKSAVIRGVWAAFGLLFFALGMVGVVLPVLPTTPFILLAAICFARSSEKLDNWFKGTKVYKMVFESYVEKRSMTVKAKLTILVPVTILLAIAFAMMGRVPIGRIVLAVVWVGHIVYFGFIVKTDPAEN